MFLWILLEGYLPRGQTSANPRNTGKMFSKRKPISIRYNFLSSGGKTK